MMSWLSKANFKGTSTGNFTFGFGLNNEQGIWMEAGSLVMMQQYKRVTLSLDFGWIYGFGERTAKFGIQENVNYTSWS